MDWPIRHNYTPGEFSIESEPLLSQNNIFVPQLHVKLGLVKTFTKSLNNRESAMSFLKDKFCKLSATKVQEGVFTGRDIGQQIKDESFD